MFHNQYCCSLRRVHSGPQVRFLRRILALTSGPDTGEGKSPDSNLGSGRFVVGFWLGFWVGLRARDFPTERVLSRTPLIIRTVDQNQKVESTY